MKKIIRLFVVLIVSTITALSQTYSGGSGTSDDPYLVSTKADLKYLSENSSDWDKYFKQTADITFADADFLSGGDFYNGGSGFIPIGSPYVSDFSGGYNGNGHRISNLKISTASAYVGFFGEVNSSGEIKDLGLENVNITSISQVVGGLAGYAQNVTITNCYTTGSVAGTYDVGGLVGGTGVVAISSCYSACSVSGSESWIGGLVGDNNSANKNVPISNCYSTGSVSGSWSYIGGLVGRNAAPIINCYSTGSVSGGSSYIGGLVGYNSGVLYSPITNCFWDTETSGQSSSGGGTGETTSAMKTVSTFFNAGWDNSIWYMDTGVNNGYPYLSWQNPGGTPLPVELSSFSASVNLGTVILKWQTATEINNQGFDIERSSPNSSFNKIGFVAGSGNSNSPQSYSFTDQPTGGTAFSYRIKQIDNNGNFKYYDPVTVNLSLLTKPELMQNSPNPFNPSTSIKFYIPNSSDVSIKIFDILGREVITLINKQAEAGYHIVYWNGIDKHGSEVASGTYICRMQAGDPSAGSGQAFVQTKKLMLMK